MATKDTTTQPSVHQQANNGSKAGDPRRFLVDTEITLFFRSFVSLLVCLAVMYAIFARKLEHAADFLSYAAPCIAGILAGAALIGSKDTDRDEVNQKPDDQRRREKRCYFWSVAFLYFGLMFYAAAHETCRSPALLLAVAGYVVPACCILVCRLERKQWPRAGRAAAIIAAIALGAAPLGWMLPYVSVLFVRGSDGLICSEQVRSDDPDKDRKTGKQEHSPADHGKNSIGAGELHDRVLIDELALILAWDRSLSRLQGAPMAFARQSAPTGCGPWLLPCAPVQVPWASYTALSLRRSC